MESKLEEQLLVLREVIPEDSDWLFELANDPEVRANSIHPEPIDRIKHQTWITDTLADPNTLYLIALDKSGNPVGQVRFCPDENNFIISISIHHRYRGKGLAGPMVNYACNKLKYERKVTGEIIAYIDPQNLASIRVFKNNDFVFTGEKTFEDRKFSIYMKKLIYRILQ